MNTHKITIANGDGTCPKIMESTIDILNAVYASVKVCIYNWNKWMIVKEIAAITNIIILLF